MRRAALILLGLLAFGPLTAAHAATSFNDVENELMCDTCNVPLTIAESTRADQERAQIRRLIAQGKTKQQILDAFVAEYGPNVLSRPTGGGSATAVWAVPTAVIVAALIGVALLLPRWRRRRTTGSTDEHGPEAQPLSNTDRERLERDLALYDL